MAENSSYITGPSRPIAGIPSTYRLNIHCETVRWEVRLNLSVLISNTTGVFTFHTASLDKTFIVQAHFTLKSSPGSVFSASLAVKPLPGVPEFTKMSWQDTHLEDIGSRRVEYLDDVYLSVRTENIPPGDRLMAKIIEKETLQEDRPAGRALYAEVDESGTARFKVSSELLKRFAEKWNAQDWINETTHQYYAEISYYGERIPDENQAIIYPSGSPPPRKGPIVRKTEKSAVLEITNVAGQAIPPNNGAKPVVALEDKNRYKKLNPVKLKVNLFFDGTKNNRENALLREKGSNRSKEEEKIYRKHGGKESDDNSYQQGYSNVALLQWSDAAKKKQKEISIYIEGIGTEDGEGDSWRGMGFDYGPTNIKAKAGKAINKILYTIKKLKIVDEKNEYVIKVELNVFGFSRGAAATRHFVSRKSEIAVNALARRKDVVFTFVGLFDTVSAHGLRLDHLEGDDVEKLHLDIGGRAQKVFQLTAKDEYRANFCLTDIESSIRARVGFEYEMPGSHSDIGGGFKNPVVEKVGSSRGKLIDKLIAEGWYTEEQKETIPAHSVNMPSSAGGMPYYYPAYCTVKRTVSNAYQYIPMEIMVNFAKKYGKMAFYEKDLKKHYAKIPDDLQPYRKMLVSDAGADGTCHREADLQGLDIKKLRNKYLHLTAFREGGQGGIMDWLVNRGRYPERGIIKG